MTRLALAIDVGGTKIEAALVDERGTVRAEGRGRRPTGPGAEPVAMTRAIAELVHAALGAVGPADQLVGAGIGTAGPIDLASGEIFPVNMPGLRGYPLQGAVAAALGALPAAAHVRQRHDGACIALAESWKGAARGSAASVSIVVSTGVGGGIVLGADIVGGASGNAGHLGQLTAPAGFEVPGESCGTVTLEHIASGPGSVRWARAQGWSGATGEQLGADAAAGDATARAAIERSARAVGIALADAATLLDLDLVAIGGGFSRVSDDYVSLVGEALAASAALPYAAKCRVVPSGLGGDGPLVGAAALVLA